MERILSRAIITSCAFLFATAGVANAESQKWIVRLKDQPAIHPIIQHLNREHNLSTMSARINHRRGLRATPYHNVNLLLVEGNRKDVQNEIGGDVAIESIEPDQPVKLAAAQPNNFGADVNNSPYLKVLGLNAANPASNVVNDTGDSPVLVAVIDTGMDLTHPFLQSSLSINSAEQSGRPGIDDDGNGFVDDVYGAAVVNRNSSDAVRNGDVTDVDVHGTHVAGLIKTVRDQAIAMGHSEAKRIQILPIRFFYACGAGTCGDLSGAIAALDYAMARGAKVVNMSWGSTSYSSALFNTLADLYNHDIVLVAAAGNNSADADSTPFFPAAMSTSIPGLISVNSITTQHQYASDPVSRIGISLSYFSNYGANSVDIAAPGSTVFNSGTGLLSAYSQWSAGNKFIGLSGTSMASPLVAGIAAVVRTINPNLNAFEIKNLLVENATVPLNQDGSKLLGNKNRAEGYVHAENSFASSRGIASSGFRPQVGTSSFGSSNDSSSGAAAGCGAITTSGGHSDSNPFGGNSMGLLTIGFFLVQIARRMSYKFKRC